VSNWNQPPRQVVHHLFLSQPLDLPFNTTTSPRPSASLPPSLTSLFAERGVPLLLKREIHQSRPSFPLLYALWPVIRDGRQSPFSPALGSTTLGEYPRSITFPPLQHQPSPTLSTSSRLRYNQPPSLRSGSTSPTAHLRCPSSSMTPRSRPHRLTITPPRAGSLDYLTPSLLHQLTLHLLPLLVLFL
jgi:hypothetical protein